MRFLIISALILSGFYSFSQKKIVSPDAYAEWNVIKEQQLSSDGAFFSYTVEPYEGNTTSYLLTLKDKVDTLLKIERGSKVKFNKRATVFSVVYGGDYEKVRALKIKETKTHLLPKDTLILWNLKQATKVEIPNVAKHTVLDSSDFVVGTLSHNFSVKNNVLSKGNEKKFKDGYSGSEKTFFIADASKGIVFQRTNIANFYLDEQQEYVILIQKETKKKKTFYTVTSVRLQDFTTYSLGQPFEKIENSYFSSKENTAFIIGKLHEKKQERNDVYRLTTDFSQLDSVLIAKKIDSNWVISPSSKFEKIENTSTWLFDLQRFEPKEEKDTLLKDEIVKLDIWTWDEPQLKTRQLFELKNWYKQKFKASFNEETNAVFPIEDDVFALKKTWKNHPIALLRSNEKYLWSQSFEYPWKEDLYQVDLRTGEKELLLKGNYSRTILTPDAEYLYYQKEEDTNFYALNLSTKAENCITFSIQERWIDDLNGMEFTPGIEGATYLDEDKKGLWFNSTKALYFYQPDENKLTQITPKEWLNRKIELNFALFEKDSLYFNSENCLISVFDLETKRNAYYTLDTTFQLIEILEGYFHAYGFLKDANNKRHLARIQTNEIYPDFVLLEDKKTTAITNVNPQQKDYNWSTVELVKWTAYDGQELEGLLYKPENYDSTQKYPLLVYYYETSTENIHRYTVPRATASIIFSTEYASSGYFVFMPDIRYEIGYPGRGAYNSIMSGTDHVVQLYPAIDTLRMGLQGQSWGGYQTTQLITMTDRYKAAMAGAPVSNMFSAYGGIRWGSGLNRQFQYEHTQSRIGKTIWEAPELYIENSPLFHLPKVTTPLLIMHNDEDGAVPWYQGIELFMGLRRLNKPAWLLNYNGDDHNLMKKGNRKDLSKRMKEFFDYYLMDSERPEWMDGIPAWKK